MSDSSDGRRRVAEVHAAQRAAQANRYRVSDEELMVDRGGERTPALEIDPGSVPWPAPTEAPEAGSGPESTFLSSLRQAIAGETWQTEPRPTGLPVTESRHRTPEPAPQAERPASAPSPATPPGPGPMPQGRPAMTRVDPNTRTNAGTAAFEAGLREEAPRRSRPESTPDALRRQEDSETLPAVDGDDTVRFEPQRQEPMPAPAPSPARMPAARSVPKPADPMANEVALAFAAGARETASLPAVPLPLPSGRHLEPPATRPQGPAGEAGQALPMTSQAAVSFEAGAREMAMPPPRGEPSMPSAQVQVAPTGPDDAAVAFDAGARQVASLPVRPPATRPRPEAAVEVERQERPDASGDASGEEEAPEGSDALQAAQQALDARLAQLTFKGIVTQGG